MAKAAKRKKEEDTPLELTIAQHLCWQFWCWALKHNNHKLLQAKLYLRPMVGSFYPSTEFEFLRPPRPEWKGRRMIIEFKDNVILLFRNDKGTEVFVSFYEFDLSEHSLEDVVAYLCGVCNMEGEFTETDKIPWGYKGHKG